MPRSMFRSLADYYDEYLEDLPAGSITVETLFEDNNARKLIQSLFKEERKNTKIKNCLNIITEYRAKHTLSAYLLGITIHDQLNFNTRDWRRLPGETSSKGSFQLFWRWICLFHDIGYRYEEDKSFFNEKFEPEDLEKHLDITNSFLAVSENAELIRNYFRYMRDKWKKFDHGILGAMLLYDALIDLSKTENLYSSIKKYQEFYVKICDAIALHNMWRANQNNKDVYEEYNLTALIPSWDDTHKVYYPDNVLLFLLGLVDTLEPFKAFVRNGRYSNPVTQYEVLDAYYMKFTNYSRKKMISIDSSLEEFDEYCKHMQGPDGDLAIWLGVISKVNADHILQIDIILKRPSHPGLI